MVTSRYRVSIVVATLWTVLVTVGPAAAQDQYLFWVGAVDSSALQGNAIFRLAVNGSSLADTLIVSSQLGPEYDDPRYLYYTTVDTLAGLIYWTDNGGSTEDSSGVYFGAIRSAGLDGSNPEIFLGSIVCGLGSLSDLAVDAAANVLYWGERSDCYDAALHRTDLTFPDPFQNRLPISSGYVVESIELDLFHYMIYWVSIDFFDETPGIVRAPINDTESDEYIVTGCVGDIALSHILSKIYWTPCDSNKILRANLDGSGAEEVLSGQGDIGNLAIDDKGRKIYWSETAEGTIRRATLDGTEVEDVLTGLLLPTSIALNFGRDPHVEVEDDAAIPEEPTLTGVFPNPVRDEATIAFNVADPVHVTLEIFDQLGRKVEQIASALYLPGRHQVRWTPAGVADGMYFVRLTTAGRTETVAIAVVR